MYKAFLIIFFVSGCGLVQHPAKKTTSPVDLLKAQYQTYLALSEQVVPASDCDALLRNALTAVGRNQEIAIEEYRDNQGAWHRLPAPNYSEKCSSSISRDMFLGLFGYIWHFRRLDLANQIWDYGTEHFWIMGTESKILENRVVLTPNMIGLLAAIIYSLGGDGHAERFLIRTYDVSPGFVSHLSLLSMWIETEINGYATEYQLNALESIIGHMSHNPLAQALYHKFTDGNQAVATDLLITVWPGDRLPTSADWCDSWRTQRSDGDEGLAPCSGETVHSGGDFLFSAGLVLGTL